MKIGVCTTDFAREPVRPLFERIRAIGFDCVQLSFDSVSESGFRADSQIEIPESVDPGVCALIRETAGRCSLGIAAVNGTFNMAHPDADVRREGVRRFEGFARAAKALGCGLVTLCSGTRSRVSLWTAGADNDGDAAWRDMADSMKAVCDTAAKYGLTLAIETEAGNIISTPERAARLLSEIGSPHLKMIMDCANLFHKGEAKRENARAVIGHAFDVFGPDVVLAHGKDILEGPELTFCAAGEGIVDFPYFAARLKALDYGGVMMLHGIGSEEKMPGCLRFVRSLV